MTAPRPSLARALGYTFAATLIFLAALVAAFGMISLFTDEEVIDIPGAGPLLGPLAALLAALIFALAALRSLHRDTGSEPARVPSRIAAGIALGLLIWVAYAVTIGAGQLLAAGTLAAGTDAALHALLRPFSLTAGVLAALILPSLLALSAAAGRGHTPTRWHWEEDS